MTYVVFSFEEGDFLRSEDEEFLTFESHGLALQYIRTHFLIEQKPAVTKRFLQPEQCYLAPFRLHRLVA